MTSCDEIRISLGALAVSALDAEEELAVREHVAGCPRCAAELAELVETVGVLAAAKPVLLPAKVPPDPACWTGCWGRSLTNADGPAAAGTRWVWQLRPPAPWWPEPEFFWSAATRRPHRQLRRPRPCRRPSCTARTAPWSSTSTCSPGRGVPRCTETWPECRSARPAAWSLSALTAAARLRRPGRFPERLRPGHWDARLRRRGGPASTRGQPLRGGDDNRRCARRRLRLSLFAPRSRQREHRGERAMLRRRDRRTGRARRRAAGGDGLRTLAGQDRRAAVGAEAAKRRTRADPCRPRPGSGAAGDLGAVLQCVLRSVPSDPSGADSCRGDGGRCASRRSRR